VILVLWQFWGTTGRLVFLALRAGVTNSINLIGIGVIGAFVGRKSFLILL